MKWGGAGLGNHLHHTLSGPSSELWAKCYLSCLVVVPAGVVEPAGVAKRQLRLGYNHATFCNGGCNSVQGTLPDADATGRTGPKGGNSKERWGGGCVGVLT